MKRFTINISLFFSFFLMIMSLIFTTSSFSQEKFSLHINKRSGLKKISLNYHNEKNLMSNSNNPPLPVINSYTWRTDPSGIAFNANYLYTIEHIFDNNHQDYLYSQIVKIFPDTGNIIETYKWTKESFPSDIEWDGKHFYILRSPKIYIFDGQFNYIREIKTPGDNLNDGFLAYDGEFIVFLDESLRKLIWINPQDESIIKTVECTFLASLSYIKGLAWDGNYFWTSAFNLDENEDYFFKIGTDGHLLKTFTPPKQEIYPTSLKYDGQFLWCIFWDAFYKLDIGNAPPLIKDTDDDGVIDMWDKCPGTQKNSCVNNKGCSCKISLIDENGTVEKGKWKTYYANVANTYSNFLVKIQNLTDDVDLYVKKGEKPDFENYDCRPYKGGKRDEQCDLSNNGDNLWYFCIYGYKDGNFSISVEAKR